MEAVTSFSFGTRLNVIIKGCMGFAMPDWRRVDTTTSGAGLRAELICGGGYNNAGAKNQKIKTFLFIFYVCIPPLFNYAYIVTIVNVNCFVSLAHMRVKRFI